MLVTLVTLILAGVVVWGLVVGEPTERDRVEALGTRIRCPVCQGESIVDSPTPYARDILAFVEERIEEGWTDEQILDYLEDRFRGHPARSPILGKLRCPVATALGGRSGRSGFWPAAG